jgi:peptidoglycan/LPS O-acetylase OafA/YrhL
MKKTLSPEFSLYLDLIRFFASIIVIFSHSSESSLTGGLFWQASDYGQTAVMVFFVLSGYVIYYVSKTKELTLKDYSIARISRIYSIVLPALLLTFICNLIGDLFIKNNYQGLWDTENIHEYYRYFISFFMLHSVWDFKYTPPNNGPFWSLSFEILYYCLFAVFIYIKPSYKKWILVFIIALIGGPTILLLYPVWLLGVLCYKAQGVLVIKKTSVITFIIIITTIALLFSPYYRERLEIELPFSGRSVILGDYVDGLLFFFHLYFAPAFAKIISSILLKYQNLIKLLGTLTFPFYLFHLPILRLIAGLSPYNFDTTSWQHRLLVLGATFVLLVFISLKSDSLKLVIKKFLASIWKKAPQRLGKVQ